MSKREYFTREVPQKGIISWDRPAREVYNFVRASDYLPFKSPWGIPRTTTGGREIAVVKTALTGQGTRERPGTIGDRQQKGIQVACANEWILITLVQLDGKFIDPAEILKPGDRLGSCDREPTVFFQE
jgi:methionyl-tRNA formyltransferase